MLFMTLIKIYFIELIITSFCMANISGIVIDTGKTPISGVVVQLENGGQTATTAADGSFTLMVNSAIIANKNRMLFFGLSARIFGDFLNISISERGNIEVTSFDLNGKEIYKVCKTLDAGSHSLSLPSQGTGIYLYKVKNINREILLKRNTVTKISFGNAAPSQGSSSKFLSKQRTTKAEINDVITATKNGLLNYHSIIRNSDTSGIIIKMIANAGNIIDSNGNVYQSVQIGSQIWTIENLRVTKYNDGSAIPLDTLESTWDNSKTPKYCFYGNSSDSIKIKKYGALYNWYVVSPDNPKKVAPTGWHVPSNAEWDTLQNYLMTMGYNWDESNTDNMIAKSLAAKTDWRSHSTAGTIGCVLPLNNRSGFSALPGGIRNGNGVFFDQSSGGYWWSATPDYERDAWSWSRYLVYGSDHITRNKASNSCGFSIRLLKDN